MGEIGITDIDMRILSEKYTARQVLEALGTYNANASHERQIDRYDVMDRLPWTVRLLREAKLLD